MTRPSDLTTIGFGGGCHWCTEAVFASLRGVASVDQGFAKSEPPNDTWSEAVRIAFDPSRITLRVLIEVHLRTHASTSNHKMRGKYRSAVYTLSETQSDEVRDLLGALRQEFDAPLVTQVIPMTGFRQSDPRFHRYFQRNAGGPFCTRYIDPKLALLRDRFADFTV
ncbi:MAG: peptide-methionine (S)-S-oxide reductase [Pseudomonadota bacterium]